MVSPCRVKGVTATDSLGHLGGDTLGRLEMTDVTRRRHVAWITSACLFVTAPPASATAILLVRVGAHIYVGADSLRDRRDIQGRGVGQRQACKIRPIGGGRYVATSGLSSTRDSNGAVWFDLDALIADATRSEGPLSEQMARIDERVKAPLLRRAAEVRRPEQLSQLDISVLLFGFEDGRATVVHHRYSVAAEAGALRVVVTACEACADPNQVVALGQSTEFMNRLPDTIRETGGDPLQVILKSLLIAVDAHPTTVGPPFNVLDISAAGATWVVGGAACAGYSPGTNRRGN